MYFKLVSNHTGFGGTQNTGYASYRRYVWEDVYKVITGTITSPSQLSFVHNSGASTITGSSPSAGIYHTTNAYRNTNSSVSGDDYFMSFYKRHHGYLQDNTNANMQRAVHIRTNASYNFIPRMGTDLSDSVSGINNDFPSSQSGFLNASSTYDPSSVGLTPAQWHSIEGIVNDKVLVIRLNQSPYSASYADMTFIMADQEYQSNYDTAQRATHQYHCPTVAIYHAEFRLEQNNTIGSTSTTSIRAGNNIGKVHMYGNNYPNGYTSNASYSSNYIMGQYNTLTSYKSYNSLLPPPWYEMHGKSPLANGNKGFIMQPLLFNPQHGMSVTDGGDHVDHKEYGRLMGIWRTGDDTFFTGERVTDGDGNAYRAFRVYKTGSPTTSNTGYNNEWGYSKEHSRSAVYLFPEGGT